MALFDEDYFFHMESSPRLHPGGVEIQSMGYISRKTEWTKRIFQSQNFSFILSGKGYYEINGTLHPVQAPVVLTQSPGVPVNYGPEQDWEELFVIYPEESFSYFERRGFLNPALWKIHRSGDIREQIEDLVYEIRKLNASGNIGTSVDRIDLAVQKLILDSREESILPRETELQVFVQDVYREIEKDSSRYFDFHSLALERGFSSSSFRRCWEAFFRMPPGQTVIEIRIRQACRQLAETDLPVKQIAFGLGYEDALYFSRLFKRKRNESPIAYRARTRDPFLRGGG